MAVGYVGGADCLGDAGDRYADVQAFLPRNSGI